jgi:hypothetical protein
VIAQGLWRVKRPGKINLPDRCMNFLVADVMQQHSRPAFATLGAWDQVVQALRHIGRDGAQAQRADGVIHKAQGGIVAGQGKGRQWTVR